MGKKKTRKHVVLYDCVKHAIPRAESLIKNWPPSFPNLSAATIWVGNLLESKHFDYKVSAAESKSANIDTMERINCEIAKRALVNGKYKIVSLTRRREERKKMWEAVGPREENTAEVGDKQASSWRDSNTAPTADDVEHSQIADTSCSTTSTEEDPKAEQTSNKINHSGIAINAMESNLEAMPGDVEKRTAVLEHLEAQFAMMSEKLAECGIIVPVELQEH